MSNETAVRLPAGVRDKSTETTSCRIEASHRFCVKGAVDRVFGLFDPVSERDWVEDWDPVPVFPPELSRAAGSVFTLDRDGRTAVWTVLRHDPAEHAAEYLVTEPDYQHRWITVNCSAQDRRTTCVRVCYVTTALSAAGRRDIGRYGDEFLRAWEAPVQAALAERNHDQAEN